MSVARPSNSHDVIILGAGAAGLMCAGVAARRGRSVLVLEQARHPGEKIRISGGGRCNFTNLHTSPANFLSDNPRFCHSALSGYTEHDFIALVETYGIAWHEKTRGQLFCDGSSRQIIDMLREECRGAQLRLGVRISGVAKGGGFCRYDGSRRVSRPLAGGRHRRAIDPENGRQRIRLQDRRTIRSQGRVAARGAGAADLRRSHVGAVQGFVRYFGRCDRQLR
jgi:hypothetical protein